METNEVVAFGWREVKWDRRTQLCAGLSQTIVLEINALSAAANWAQPKRATATYLRSGPPTIVSPWPPQLQPPNE